MTKENRTLIEKLRISKIATIAALGTALVTGWGNTAYNHIRNGGQIDLVSLAAKDPRGFSEEEIRQVIFHAHRIGVEPELLFAIAKAENGSLGKEYGIMPQGELKERYALDQGYNIGQDFVKYKSGLEKQIVWCAKTVKNRQNSFPMGNKRFIDFIDFLGNSYAPYDSEKEPNSKNAHWEKNVRHYYREFKGLAPLQELIRIEKQRHPNFDETRDTKEEEPKKIKDFKQVMAAKLPMDYKPKEYPSEKVPANMCSRYVRLSASDLFNKVYASDDAWNMRYHQNIVASGNLSLDELENSGKLRPGMAVGMVWPNSRYNNRKDIKGNNAKYTHIGLYVGERKDGQPVIIHKFGKKTYAHSERELRAKGLAPVEVLDVK